MHRFTNIELVYMQMAYGARYRNTNEARQINSELHPQCHILSHTSFSRFNQSTRNTGEVGVKKRKSGTNRTVRNVVFENEILQQFESNSKTSTWAISHAIKAHTTAGRKLKDIRIFNSS